MAWLILLIAAWGVLAFGAIYSWARWPLLAACVVAGAWGLTRPVPRERRGVNRPMLTGLALVILAVSVQLVPLGQTTIRHWSLATHAFLRQYDVVYAMSAGELAHPMSIDPAKTWTGLGMLAGLGFMLLGLTRGIGGRDLRVIAPRLVGLGLLVSMIGIVQKALWNGRVYGFWEPINRNAVAFGPFINRNHFAGWLLLVLPVAIAYFASLVAKGMGDLEPGWRKRMVWFSTPEASRAVLTGFAVLVMAVALTLTMSRSGIACFLLAMVLSAFHVLRWQASAARGRLTGTFLAVVVATAVAWAGIDAVATRFAEVDWQLAGRAGAWADAWRIHRSFPWFGTGLNTYGSATLLLQEFQKGVVHYVEAHNDYLQLLVEGGWLVAAPALLLIGLFGREVRRRFREDLDDRTGHWLRLGAVTGIVAVAFQEAVEFSLQMPGNAALFTVLCAVAARRATAKGTRGSDPGLPHPGHRRAISAAGRRASSASASRRASSASG